MRLHRIAVLAFLCAWCALTGAAETERRPAITTKISVVDGALPGDAALAPLALSIRRYANLKVDVAAYDRLDGALADLARARGASVVAQSADAAVRVEVDSTFYVYTNRFNARLVRLPEYADWQLHGGAPAEVAKAASSPVDVLRVAAGAVGIVRGWISPSFGAYMMSTGTMPALFGSGKAPTRLIIPNRERFERGEQEVNTKVKLTRGTEVVTFGVRSWMVGDAEPFKVDELVAENWSLVMDVIRGMRAPDTTVEGPMH